MGDATYPGPDVLLARLARSARARGDGGRGLSPGELPTGDFLRRLAERVGMRSEDLHLVAGLPVPGGALPPDEAAGRELPLLVRRALRVPEPGRRRLRDFARSLPEPPRTAPPRQPRPHEEYPRVSVPSW